MNVTRALASIGAIYLIMFSQPAIAKQEKCLLSFIWDCSINVRIRSMPPGAAVVVGNEQVATTDDDLPVLESQLTKIAVVRGDRRRTLTDCSKRRNGEQLEFLCDLR